MKSDERVTDSRVESSRVEWNGRTGLAMPACLELRTFVYSLPVVNKNLSVKVPYTGRFWLHKLPINEQ